MSAFGSKADMPNVRYSPKADTSGRRFRSDSQPQLSDEPLRIAAPAIRDTEHCGAVCGILSGAADRARKAPARSGEHAPTADDLRFIGAIGGSDERARGRVRAVVSRAPRMIDLVPGRRSPAFQCRELVDELAVVQQSRTTRSEQRHSICIDRRAVAGAMGVSDPVPRKALDDPLGP